MLFQLQAESITAGDAQAAKGVTAAKAEAAANNEAAMVATAAQGEAVADIAAAMEMKVEAENAEARGMTAAEGGVAAENVAAENAAAELALSEDVKRKRRMMSLRSPYRFAYYILITYINQIWRRLTYSTRKKNAPPKKKLPLFDCLPKAGH